MADPVTQDNTVGKGEEVKTVDLEHAASVLFDNKDTPPSQVVKPEEKKEEPKVEVKTEEKKTEGDPAKVEDVKDDKTKTEETPVELKDFVLPEGFVADATVMTEFKTVAKELKLSQEQAQKLVDMQTKLTTKNTEAIQKQWADTQKDWRSKSEGDKEIGGKDFQANVGIAKKALDKFGTKDFKEAIEYTGMGNHPELIRFLYKVGKAISEDGIISGGRTTAGPRDAAKVLFPGMN